MRRGARADLCGHPLNLRHIVVTYRTRLSVAPRNGHFTSRRSDNRAKIGCRGSLADAVAGFQSSGLFAGHWFSFRLRLLGSIKTKPLKTNASPKTISEVPRALNSVPVISSTNSTRFISPWALKLSWPSSHLMVTYLAFAGG
jgi:hypothetical protein